MALQQNQTPQANNSTLKTQRFAVFFNKYAMTIAIGIATGIILVNFVNMIVKDLLSPLVGLFIHPSYLSSFTFVIAGSQFFIGDFISALILFLLSILVIYLFFLLTRALQKRYKSENP